MDLVRRARLDIPQEDEGEESSPPVWETDPVLDLLGQRLDSRDRKLAQGGVDLMVAIGAPTFDKLIEILETSETITTRKRGLEALEEIEESPAQKLLPLLEESRVWYIQRNTVYVFHRRAEDVGVERCKQLWPTATLQVRVEILRYLLGHGDAPALLRQALDDRDRTFALWAARQAIKTGDKADRLAVIEREQRIPALQLGSGFHIDLLSTLTQSGATGRAYVAAAAQVRAPVLPWRKARFESEMAELLEERSG
jgi:HEAT repeat protein